MRRQTVIGVLTMVVAVVAVVAAVVVGVVVVARVSGGLKAVGLTRGVPGPPRSRGSQRPPGRSYGVDFDPAADRLRVIGDIGQNLRPDLDDPQRAPAAARR
jgi:hypothetical protein